MNQDFKVIEGSGKDNIISAQEFIELSQLNGWGKNRDYDLKKVQKALENTFYITVIRNTEGKLLAFVRCLSDDMFFTTIPDIHTHPEYMGNGYATILITKAKEKLGHTKFYFGAQEGLEGFYEKLGFKKDLQSYGGKFS